MALLFMDGFDHYDDDEIPYKWDKSYDNFNTNYYKIVSTNPRRVGSDSLLLDDVAGVVYLQKNIAFGDKRCILGIAFRVSGLFNSSYFISLYGVGVLAQITFQLTTFGSIAIYRGNSSGTLLGISSSGLIKPSVWYYIEINSFINNSTGSFEVRLNGVNILSDSNVDTQYNTTDSLVAVRFGSPNNLEIQFDDLYVCDGTGASHNDFLGDCKVDTVFPSAAGNYSQWTPSGEASNYLCVDETVPNDDTDYVTTNISGEIDTYNFGNLVDYSGETIHAVALNICKKKDDVGFMSSYPVIRIGANDYSGELINTYESYHYQQEIWETNPDDSQAWEEEDINSGEYGIKMQED